MIMKMLRNTKGASAVEFAILLPLLVLMLFGLIEFSLLFFNKQVITNASREGARAGIVARNPRLPETNIRQIVLNYCAQNLVTFDNTRPPPDVTLPDGYDSDAVFGDDLRVRVTYRYRFLVLPGIIVGLFGGSDISQNGELLLVAETVMRYE
jgi:Flp pilus assembly protein TadG